MLLSHVMLHSLQANFFRKAETTQNKLGIRSFTLYTKDGTLVQFQTVNDYNKGKVFSHNTDISSYAESKKTSYAVVAFVIGNTALDKVSKIKIYYFFKNFVSLFRSLSIIDGKNTLSMYKYRGDKNMRV